MKRILKRALSIFLVAVLVFGTAPLNGLIGLEFPKIGEIFPIKALATNDKYDVNYYVDGVWQHKDTFEAGASVTVWSYTPGEGLTFSDWGDQVPATMPANNVDVHGTTGVLSYTITFTINGEEYATGSFAYGSTIVPPEYEVPEGYTFNGWNIPATMPAHDITIDATLAKNGTELISGSCGESLTWTFDESTGTLTISATGTMTDWTSSSLAPWYSYRSSIKTIKINSGVTNIGARAFYGCNSFATIIIPESVTSIGSYAFSGCSGLTEIDVPQNVTTIGSCAFQNCTNVEKIVVPEGVTTISAYAFSGTSITSITVPKSVTTLYSNPTDYSNTESRYYSAFAGANKLQTVIFGDGITAIPARALKGCSQVTNVVIPEGVTTINTYAFYDCSKLSDVKLPSTLKTIGNYAFSGCSSITEINLTQGLTTINAYAFSGTSITSITVPKSATTLYSYLGRGYGTIDEDDYYSAFAGASKLQTVIFEEGTTSIPARALKRCSQVESIVVPEGVTAISIYAFNGCSKLKNVVLPSTLKTVGEYAFAGCTGLSEINIPTNVTAIGNYAFNECANIESIVIGEGITTINAYVFSGCSKLKDVILPITLKTIGNYAFSGCSSITEINLPQGLTTINAYAFSGTSITSITVPKSVTTLYGVLKSGYGTIDEGDYYSAFAGASKLQTVIFEEGTTSIPARALKSCSQVTNVVIPESATTIGSYAFSGCSGLIEIYVPQNVTTIGSYAFQNCTNVEKFVVPEGVTTINTYTFYGCSKLSDVVLQTSLLTIGDYAFYECVDITDVYFIGTEEQWNEVLIGENNSTLVNATFHFSHIHTYGEWIIERDSNCTLSGIKYRVCSECNYKAVDISNPLGHSFGEWSQISEPTCSKLGEKHRVCFACGYEEKAEITTLDHTYSDSVTEPTCSKGGYTTHTCIECGYFYSDTNIAALGHSFGEWAVKTEASCSELGVEYRICTVCQHEERKYTNTLEHIYGDWSIEKESSVLAEGVSVRVCSGCGNRDEQILERVYVDIETNENYGLANFTVVNAQTKEPIEGASIFISTEKDGENTFSTDADGKVSVILPVGKQSISAYAEGCLTRNLRITVKSGKNDIPAIGLSDKETYDAKLTAEEMTYDEIIDAGIDPSAPGNNHVFEYELKLEFEPGIDWASLLFYMNGNGDFLGPKLPSGGGGNDVDFTPGRSWTWISPEGGDKGHFAIESKEGKEEIIVYPVSEYMYLIIRGEVTWLKEMFDVEMLVINNSMTDTLEKLTCTLDLPEGLSLATMVEGQQNLVQTINHIAEGESESIHWYVRGDEEGSYNLKAKLEGTIMPFEEKICEEFMTENAIQVWAGSALHLHFEFPDAAYYGVDYPVRITLTNVSNKSLYNVTHAIKNIEQSKIVHYSNGNVVNETYMDKNFIGRKFVKEFRPGDKIVMETSINILFKSELIEYELKKLIGLVDGIEQLVQAYKGISAALDILQALDRCISGCVKALDEFLESTSNLAEAKMDLARDLYKSISKLLRKCTSSGNKAVDCAAKIGDSSLILVLDALASDPAEFLENHAEDDIKALIKDVEGFGNLVDHDDEELKKFDIFDSIRTAIESLPVVFALRSVILTEGNSNTTRIPWSYSATDAGPQYFGVSNVSRYFGNIAKATGAEVWEELMPSYLQVLPGLDDPFNYDQVKREIIAVEKEIAEFKAKDATGEVTFRAWVERNEPASFSARAADFFTQSNSDFDISCDNETAEFDKGVLTFTGDGTISVTPLSTVGGTLIIEDSKGNRYEYVMTVVEQHECVEGEKEILFNPTGKYDGVAVRRCTTCKDVLDVELLSASNCETHSFGEWKTDCEATCSASGIVSRECTLCGYCETDYSESLPHTPGGWTTVPETETEAEKQIKVCTVCGEVTDEKYVDYIPVESVSLDFTSMDILNTQKGKLAVSVLPEKASNRSVVWSSGDKNIVTVSNDGTVTAVAPGTAEITVTTEDGNLSATCVVTVLPRTFNVTWDSGENKTVNGEKEGTIIAVPEAPVKDGYTFTGWTPEVPDVMPAENLIFTATWKVNSYDAVFDANGGKWDNGSETKTVPTDFNVEIKAPEAPEKQGYIFSKWSPEVGVMDSVDGKKFVAEWIPATDTRYTVETYIMNTLGEYEKDVQTLNGITDSIVTAEYIVESGFALNTEKSVLSGIVAADNSLVLKVYIDRNTYTFITVVDGVSTETLYLYGSMISEPVTPSKTDYKFIEWDGTIPETMPTENVTITAVFEKCYLCPECGNEILGEDAIKDHIASETKVTISDGVIVTSGELKPSATIAVSAPQIDGKIFSHWTVDGATVEDEESAETKIVLGNGKITITAEYDDCDCKCHKGGIIGFFYKIVLFFQKLFGNNLECFCGKKH